MDGMELGWERKKLKSSRYCVIKDSFCLLWHVIRYIAQINCLLSISI